MEERLPGQNITLETRVAAEQEVNKQLKYDQILEVLGDKEMTAKEIAQEMYMREWIPTNERNYVSPRATEMLIDGRLEVIGKKICEWTGKKVSVYKRRNKDVEGN